MEELKAKLCSAEQTNQLALSDSLKRLIFTFNSSLDLNVGINYIKKSALSAN